MRFFLLFFILISFTCCEKLKPETTSHYFDMDSLVNAQYDDLKFSLPKIEKETTLNSNADVFSIQPDSTQWSRELEIFRRANINKPVLRGVYEKKITEHDGMMTWTYTPTGKKDLLVQELKITYHESPVQLRKIEAILTDFNPIYKTRRLLAMTFDHQNRLSGYRVEGRQKMTLNDSVNFVVEGRVVR